MKKLAAIAAVLVLFSPALLLVGIGMIFSPGANASCATTSASGTREVGPLPDSLEVTTADGQTFTLKTIQLTHAATIIQTGFQIEGVTRDGLQIALMSALTESNLWMPANTSVYADSGNYPHDGDASDHDSLCLFQMRPQAGWSTVPDLMDPIYQARAFFGGPNHPSHAACSTSRTGRPSPKVKPLKPPKSPPTPTGIVLRSRRRRHRHARLDVRRVRRADHHRTPPRTGLRRHLWQPH